MFLSLIMNKIKNFYKNFKNVFKDKISLKSIAIIYIFVHFEIKFLEANFIICIDYIIIRFKNFSKII